MWNKFVKHIDIALFIVLLVSIGFDVYKIWFQ